MDAKGWAKRLHDIGNQFDYSWRTTASLERADCHAIAYTIDALIAERYQLQAEVETLKNKTTGDY